MEEIKDQLQKLQGKFQKIISQIDRDKLGGEIRKLEAQMSKVGFWGDPDHAKIVSQTLSEKQKFLTTLEGLESKMNNALTLSQKLTLEEDLKKEIGEINSELEKLELHLFLSGPHDSSEAILSIHAGTGGVEAMDWAAMLARMYQRYFEKMGRNYEITNESLGEEAGYKSISMIIHAPYAYGYLKGEAGTHRLVRQSPFNADHLRQTSFALVEVLPVIEDEKEVEIRLDDLEFEAFRSSGHGGQNVNKVSTAVRLTHKPTGLVVTAQTERSQLQNRENALKLLKAKLWELKQQQKDQTTQVLKGEYQKASWGTQIRSFVLHPYHLVKDLRTSVETADTEAVLDGDLSQFVEAKVRLDKTSQK